MQARAVLCVLVRCLRAIRMLLHGWEAVDLFLEARPGGGLEVVREQTRVGAFS